MEYQLVLMTGRKRGASFTIATDGLVLGRDADADIVISDPTVSRKHCRVYLRGEAVLFEDLKSLNPTLVNGMPAASGELKLGDEIAVGSWRLLLTSSLPAEPALEKDVAGLETWSWSKAQTVGMDADSTGVPSDNRPRTVQDLAFLYEMTRALSDVDTLRDLVTLVWRRVDERFKPAASWIARVHGQGDLTFFEPDELLSSCPPQGILGAAGCAPLDIMARALHEGHGLLAPGTARRDGRKVLLCTLVAPVRLGGMNVAIIAIQTQAPQGAYDEEDLRLLVLMAQLVAPFISAIENLEQLRRDNERLRSRAGESLAIVGTSRTIRQLRAAIARAAKSDLSVLITGESGTGKELAVRLLHAESSRHRGPLVVVNCAAIPRDLFESEFFGYEKGAFTGALEPRTGLFSLAHGGTLFLDEVGNLSLDNQARILRSIELGTFRRIGAREESHVDVRIVAATNIDVSGAIKKGQFREDLHNRLNGFEIHIPPLRDHPSDIPVLAEYFFQMAKKQAKRPLSGIAREAHAHLLKRTWPGNVRELRNTILRGISVAREDTLQVSDLRAFSEAPSHEVGQEPELLSLEKAEKRYIVEVLRRCDGNVPRAAQILEIGRSTLYRKLGEYGVTP